MSDPNDGKGEGMVDVPDGYEWVCDDCDFETDSDDPESQTKAREHDADHPDHDWHLRRRYQQFPDEAVCDRCEIDFKQAGEDYCPLCVQDLGGPAKPWSMVDPEDFA